MKKNKINQTGGASYNMKEELIYKKIDNFIEIRKNLWTTVIVLSGGIAGLAVSLSDFAFNIGGFIRLALFLIGAYLDYFFVNSIIDTNKEINKLMISVEGEK